MINAHVSSQCLLSKQKVCHVLTHACKTIDIYNYILLVIKSATILYTKMYVYMCLWSEQWAVGIMGCRNNGPSEKWAVGTMGRRNNDT